MNKNKLLALLATLEDVASDAPFFTDYAATWFSTKKHSIKPTTFSKYAFLYRKHLKPALGTKRLSDITRMDIQGLINHMDDEGYSMETMKATKALLSSMLKLAVADDHILKNPCDAVKLPRHLRRKKRPATPEEYQRLLEVTKDHRLSIAIPLLFLTGMRRGEMLALTWYDIDLSQRLIHINKEYVTENGTGKAYMRDTTKTPAGVRDIPICDDLLKALKANKAHVGPRKTYVIPQHDKDKPTHPQVFYRLFKRWLQIAGLDHKVTPHSARHYFASNMLKAGVNPETLRKITGHSDLSTLLDVYCYDDNLDEKSKATAIQAMRDLSPSCPENRPKSA